MIEAQKVVFVVVNRGDCNKLIGLLNANGFTYHSAVLARGTAPTEMQAYFGLGETEKAIVMCFTVESRAAELFGLLRAQMGLDGAGGGIAFSVRVSGIAGMSMLNYIREHEGGTT